MKIIGLLLCTTVKEEDFIFMIEFPYLEINSPAAGKFTIGEYKSKL